MSKHICPVCSGNAVGTVETVDSKKLIGSYRRKGIDVSAYLESIDSISLHKCEDCDVGFFFPPSAGDGAFYEQLQTYDWYYQDEKPEYLAAKKLVDEGSSVLEVGCGKGAFRSWLPDSVEYTGLEFNDEAIRKARGAGLNVLKEPVEAHADGGKRYDVVCTFQVLEHVEQPGSFFHACAQALKPGGKLIVAVPSQDSFLSVAANSPLNMPPHHLTRWSDRALTNLAKREGFATAEIWHEPVADYHKDWHATTLAFYALSRYGLIRPKLVDDSFRYRLLGRVVQFSGVRDRLARRAAKARPELGYGHTVMLVAQ
jgi:2-polyprenyl-3-methyl-5-hydroxy-6-metoxy-1,4-benzoquinol methylase